MFRRLPHTLPADPIFEPDLEKLGFFVNSEDKVRGLKNPERKFQYLVNRNDRWNQVHRGANNAAVRNIITDRLAVLGLGAVRLPLGVSQTDPHVPILVSKDIGTKDRVIVLFGERNAEPGIISWRVIGEEGIKHGSLVEFVEAVLSVSEIVDDESTLISSTGLIVTNPCQLLWYRGGGRAVSTSEWLTLPRPSAVHDAPRVDPIENTIPQNRDFAEHIAYVFDEVIPSLVKKTVKLDVIGVEFTGKVVLDYLAEHWVTWSPRINGIALIAPQHNVSDFVAGATPSDFAAFLSQRCRAYFVALSSIDTPVVGRENYGCNCYSSGETTIQESALVRCWRHILDWFDLLHVNPSYEEFEFEVLEKDEEVKLGW